MRVLPAVSLIFLLFCGTPAAQMMASAAGSTYRVFLKTGEPLPSHGEPALVGDRVIFNLIVGAGDAVPVVQLVNLPASGVDTARTSRYVHAMRATHYAATRGEADYAALTAEVARVLDQLPTIEDARRRLALAEGARRQMLDWSEQHFHYRASDIRELASLFDDVIAELRVAVGGAGVSFALVAPPPALEVLLPAPTTRETVALALSAAKVADNGAERMDILRHAATTAKSSADIAAGQTIAAALQEEVKAGTAYEALIAAMRTRADVARRNGDVDGVERIGRELARQDRILGHRRPAEIQAFNSQLAAMASATRAFRQALNEHARQLAALRLYERQVRPLVTRFDALDGVLEALREMRGVADGRLAAADAELQRLVSEVAVIKPPAAQSGLHATFQGALRIAREACARRRLATSSQSPAMREASAAASGALMLAGQVRRDLAAGLRRPTIQ
jgi:hypothetical protein